MAIKFSGKEINSIVLDFDGTFYSNEKYQNIIWVEARKKLINKIFERRGDSNVTPQEVEEKIEEYLVLSWQIGWLEAYVEMGGTPEDYYEITSIVSKAEFLEYDEKLVSLLEEFFKHVSVYIFSGSTRKTVTEALKILIGDSWMLFEDNLLAMDDMKNGAKPELAAYQEMVERFGINSQEAIFVDDQELEVDSASALGFYTFLIAEGNQEEVVGSHILLHSVVDLLDHLEIVE